MTLRWRLVTNGQTLLDLVDIFQSDGFTRISGLSPVQAQVFYNNAPQPWSTISGSNVTDAQVLAGYVYWTEAQPGLGVYSVRWRPNAVGFWRLSFAYPDIPQIVTYDYDVVVFSPASSGLNVSFIT